MVRVAWQMLRHRPANAIATTIALLLAVAIVTGCGVLLESGLRYHGRTERYAAASLLVARPDLRTVQGHGDNRSVENAPLPERAQVDRRLAPRIAALPGVQAAVPDAATPVDVDARPASAHPWSAAVLTPFRLRTGRAPHADDEVVLDATLAAATRSIPGSRIRLTLPSGVRSFTVSGIAAPVGARPDQPTVFLTGAEARAAERQPDQADVIGVITQPGVDVGELARSVQALLPKPPANSDGTGAFPKVYTGADRGLAENPAAGAGREIAIVLPPVFGGSALLIALIVVSGTVGLSVRQRHRDVALLRAIAATPRQVRRLAVRETATLGLLAGLPGLALGIGGARWIRGQFVAHGLTPSSFEAHVSWIPPLVGCASMLLIAVTASWVAGLRASRTRPVEALAESAVEARRLGIVRGLLGLIALAGGITLSVVTQSVGGDTAAGAAVGVIATLVVAVAFLAPWLIRLVARTSGIVLRSFSPTARLATAETAASARALAPVITSLVLAVGLSGSLWFMQTSIEHRAKQESRAGLLATEVVEPAGDGLPRNVAAVMAEQPGVIAATAVVRSTMLDEHDGSVTLTAQGVDPSTLAATMDLGVTSGNLSKLRPGTVAVDQLTARADHLTIGGQFRAWFGDGTPADLRVVAIYTRGLGWANVTMPIRQLRPHTAGEDSLILLRTEHDRPAGLTDALHAAAPGATIAGRSSFEAALDKSIKENAWANQMIAAVLVAYVLIAAANTLAISALGRRRELAALRLAGMTRRQLRRMVSLEQAILLVLALAVGGAIAAAALIPIVKAATGTSTPYIPPVGWIAVIGGTVLLAAFATMVPIQRLLRVNPVAAIGVRE